MRLLARVPLARDGRWQFRKWYFGPRFKGGSSGNETCLQQSTGKTS